MSPKLILHIPHASDKIPDKSGYIIADNELKQEMLLLTDWYTDDLFCFGETIPLIADFNRVFCDVERFANDEHEVMSQFGMGVTYTKRDNGEDLRHVSNQLKNDILNKYYYPHHRKLTEAVAEQLATTDKALIIDCHSFSSSPFKRDLNQNTPRPDICIGVDEFHTPRGLYKLAAAFAKLLGTVKVNSPYSGSIVPMDYYRKDKRVMSIMIEINRDLYLVPGTNQKSNSYDKVKSEIQKLLITLSRNKYEADKELPHKNQFL